MEGILAKKYEILLYIDTKALPYKIIYQLIKIPDTKLILLYPTIRGHAY